MRRNHEKNHGNKNHFLNKEGVDIKNQKRLEATGLPKHECRDILKLDKILSRKISAQPWLDDIYLPFNFGSKFYPTNTYK